MDFNYVQLAQLQQPLGICGCPNEHQSQDMTLELPAKAQEKGWLMLDMVYTQPHFASVDPVIIFDRRGRILHCFRENHIPTFDEIRCVSDKLLTHLPGG